MKGVVHLQDWDFIPAKLILWRKNTLENECLRELDHIPICRELRSSIDILAKADWQDVVINPLQIAQIGISVATNCQLRCRYCLAHSTENGIQEISNEKILLFVEDLLAKQVARNMLLGNDVPINILFTGGGEPTYDFEKFKALVCSIRRLEAKYSVRFNLKLTTNGMCDKSRINFICTSFDRIMISYDGLPEIHNRNRPSPHYQDTASIVEASILHVLAFKIPLVVRTTIALSDIPLMKKMADNLYVKFGSRFSWSILPVIPKGRAINEWNNNDTRIDFYREFVRLQQYVKEKYGSAIISSPLFSNKENDFHCGAIGILTRTAWLRSTGQIVTCQEMEDNQTVIGEVKDGYVEFKKHCSDVLLRITKQKFQECINCVAFPFCRGGCPAFHQAYEKVGNVGLSWVCKQTISFWKDTILRVANGENTLGWCLEPIVLNSITHGTVYRFRREE